MREVSKRETKAEQQRNRREARVGLASNVLGLAAGGAALATAAKNPAFRSGRIQDAGPVTRRLVAATRGKLTPKRAKRIVQAGAAGAIGLQAANFGGDVVTNRVLLRESKSDKQSVTKSYEQRGETGVGVNLEFAKASLKGKHKCPECELPCDSEGKCPRCGKDCRHEAKETKAQERREDMAKAARRFDSEADRQRRLGMYAGLGGGVAVVAGDRARRGFERIDDVPKGGKKTLKSLRGVKLKSGGLRGTLIATGVTAAGAGLGVGAYRRGISRRNQPWD